MNIESFWSWKTHFYELFIRPARDSEVPLVKRNGCCLTFTISSIFHLSFNLYIHSNIYPLVCSITHLPIYLFKYVFLFFSGELLPPALKGGSFKGRHELWTMITDLVCCFIATWRWILIKKLYNLKRRVFTATSSKKGMKDNEYLHSARDIFGRSRAYVSRAVKIFIYNHTFFIVRASV